MAIKANRLDDASTFLSKELGREPKIEELAKYLSMTEEEVKDIMKISLDALLLWKQILNSHKNPWC